MKLGNWLALAAMSIATIPGAQAGEVLRLKAGGLTRIESMQSLSAASASKGLFVVQWKGSVQESEKGELAHLGLKILGYVPDDAFLVQGSGAAAQAASQLSFVRAVAEYGAQFKIEPELTSFGVFGFGQTVRVFLQAAPGTELSSLRSRLTDSVQVSEDLLVGSAEVGTLWQLAKRDDVLWIERYLPLRTMHLTGSELGADANENSNPSRTGYESGTRLIGVDAMYGAGMSGQGQVVAVADTGLDTGDLSSLGADFQGQLKKGLAMGLGGKSWGDPMMHGTHVSGSILGNGSNSGGFLRGGAYSSQLVMLGMWSDIMNNIMPPSLDKLFDAAFNEGAKIQSNSWGAPNSAGRYDSWAALVDGWLFNHPDFLAMFAAGNDGSDMNADGVIDEGSLSSPGSAKNVLTVGASKNFLTEGGIQRAMKELRNGSTKWGAEPIASSKLSDDPRGMAAFSSRGPAADGRIKPEIVAPGTNIVSVRDKHPKADPSTMSWGVYDDNYVFMGGTSMATPVAAGGAALVRQFLVSKMGTESISSALLKATMANTAEDLFPGQFGERASGQEQPTRRPNNHEGWGRVNLGNVVSAKMMSLYDEKAGLATGAVKEFSVAVSDTSKPLRITMAYTDAPGAASAARTLVNDLDLVVTAPNGETKYPNGRSDKDSINNMEQVDFLAPSAGTYRVTVRGANVPQGKNGMQPFALVISQ